MRIEIEGNPQTTKSQTTQEGQLGGRCVHALSAGKQNVERAGFGHCGMRKSIPLCHQCARLNLGVGRRLRCC